MDNLPWMWFKQMAASPYHHTLLVLKVRAMTDSIFSINPQQNELVCLFI